ncbi:DNA helicase RecQ [Rhodocaloribacter litoris]|uniref:DNA helicase RecQ n=1 Tax=Rhodocaloribacter litoris TaxID=2558931 RepID=UPI00141D9DC5|nr:DNA helicase RecQ [Rhodocaloribacter litoris]QXD15774.1 DNA helicase RecQ [Rhodocaloribacter litoris]GIV60275.1 MAG: ATP-dependent DNA helicase RecQ [Rhodothermaceae bacterium]
MSPASSARADAVFSLPEVLSVVRRYWGYDRLRPLQEEAIRAGLEGRDALVVMPTGGGKSLCYQVPPLLAGRMDVVISPLISLMKDQVDGLRANGYPAATLHSALSAAQKREALDLIARGACRLLFLSPERVLTPWFFELAERHHIRTFAVDEAHCISHWGHDFRPEYRRLAQIKERFPEATLHAYTATATERVRQDIITQLRLRDPDVLVGRFDRPNLIYRVFPRLNLREQLLDVLDRHRGEAVIVYCITRDETERLAASLREAGFRAAAYHAGMPAGDRRAAQEAFTNEEIDVIVATVAFGMGIDRSDVRCVIHAGMPQSVEHYQQETGRAGRDGLAAECILFYSPADTLRWQSLIEKRGANTGEHTRAHRTRHAARHALRLLAHMRRFAAPGQCRHKSLSEYFGQPYERENCGACDVCLDEVEQFVDGTTEAQMILSCVVRTGERFGAGHLADILRGSDTERIRKLGHDRLSTFGLLKDRPKNEINHMIFQLVDQGLLTRTPGDYPILKLNDASWEVLRGQRTVWLLPAKKKAVRRTAVETASWEGVDRRLFERLRRLRTEIARERGLPPYVIFNDTTLRDMARQRPTTPAALLRVHGVGEKKLADFGERFLAVIAGQDGRSPGPAGP